MLRLIQVGSSLPTSFPVDPTCTFEPGMIAQLKVLGNEVVCGVSDGTAPIGIIDDINTSAFTASIIDEVVIIPAVNDGHDKAAGEVMKNLRFSNIIRSSFISDVEGLILVDVNGVIIAPAGTPLNYDYDGDGTLDAIKVICSYTYRIANIPGDNTTVSSGRITVWFQRGIYETDQFDAKQAYLVNATLFVNSNGLLTTEQQSPQNPGIAICTGQPSSILNTLEFMWM